MRYGLLGERLGHSFSRDIHNSLGNYSYDLIEVSREELERFIKEKDFGGVNVTIPYKGTVIPYLDKIDERAKAIGAVNTIVNRGGELIGYNTDFFGMVKLINHAKIDLKDKVVAILGTGGTSRTALAVAEHLGGREIFKVSRSAKEDAISYEELYRMADRVDVIINTTPSGMFPDINSSAVDISSARHWD